MVLSLSDSKLNFLEAKLPTVRLFGDVHFPSDTGNWSATYRQYRGYRSVQIVPRVRGSPVVRAPLVLPGLQPVLGCRECLLDLQNNASAET